MDIAKQDPFNCIPSVPFVGSSWYVLLCQLRKNEQEDDHESKIIPSFVFMTFFYNHCPCNSHPKNGKRKIIKTHNHTSHSHINSKTSFSICTNIYINYFTTFFMYPHHQIHAESYVYYVYISNQYTNTNIKFFSLFFIIPAKK